MRKLDPFRNVRFRADDGEGFYLVGTRINGNHLFEVSGPSLGSNKLFEFDPFGVVLRPKKYRGDSRFFAMNRPRDGSAR